MSDAKGSAAYVEAIEQLKKLCGDDYKPRDVVIDEVAALQADNARLRALVKAAEYAKIEVGHGMSYGDEPGPRYAMCPWCDAAGLPHVADCPAFTADGVVR